MSQIDRVRALCTRFTNVSVTRVDAYEVFNVNGKPFAAYGGASDYPMVLSFRADQSEIPALLARADIVLMPQFDDHPWLAYELPEDGKDWSEAKRLLAFSYELALR